MAYPYWPESLPQCMRADGFAMGGAMPVRRQEMESGPDRVTRMSSTTVRNNTYSVDCTTRQLAEFWSFYENDANAGAGWVQIPMFTANKVLPHVARFTSYPSVNRNGLGWRVTFSLETSQQQYDWS